MIKSIILALSVSLCIATTPSMAETTKPKAKTAVTEAKKVIKEATKDAKEAVKKPAGLSESDKALQEAATKEAAKLTPTQNAKLLKHLNAADSKGLQEIDGLGEAKAANVMKKRPFSKVEDVIMVDGVGESTFANMVAWAKGDKAAPAKEAKAEEKKPAAKADDKKAETKKPATPAKKAAK